MLIEGIQNVVVPTFEGTEKTGFSTKPVPVGSQSPAKAGYSSRDTIGKADSLFDPTDYAGFPPSKNRG